MKIDIVKDGSPIDDCSTYVYIDGKYYKHGDWYHDKIDDFMKGFCDAMSYLGMTHELNRHFFNLKEEDEAEILFYENKQPKDLKDILKYKKEN